MYQLSILSGSETDKIKIEIYFPSDKNVDDVLAQDKVINRWSVFIFNHKLTTCIQERIFI